VTYDAEGNQASTTDRQGRTTRYAYDALNRLVKTIYADGATSGIRYDAVGRVAATIDANNKETLNQYDDAGRLESVTTPDLRVTTFGYDPNGNRTSVTDANSKTTLYEYDALNRLTKTTLPNLKTASIVWNVNGTKQSETDFSGNRTEYGYDAMGRLNQVTQTNGATAQVTAYGFDQLGNKTRQTDAEGRTTTWDYDSGNRVTSRTLPGGQKETFTYDAVGNLIGKTDFAGKTSHYGYTALYQPNQVILPNGSTITTTYTASGQVSAVTVNVSANSGLQSGATAYAYDAQDRLTRQTNPDGSFLAYGYDANGNIIQRSTPAGTTTYAYDASQRLQVVTGSDGKATGYTYDATGRIETATLPNGTTANYQYDDNGRLQQILHTKAGSIVTGVKYTLADNGQRTKAEEYDSASTQAANVAANPALTRDYQYDSTGRLTQEKVTDRSNAVVRTTGYGYDKVGNRSSKSETTAAGTETIAYGYDSNDRLTQETKTTVTGSQVLTTYTWDANGNVKTKTTGTSATFYVWNADNRLIEVKQGNSEAAAITVAKYSYDASGNRTQKVEGDKVTTYLVDGTFAYAQTVQENIIQGQTTTSTSYVWGNGLIAQNRAGQPSYYHAVGLGNITALTDGTGAATDTYAYDAFGSIENKTGTTANNYRYTGEYFDEAIQLQYNRARWYDASVGRFVAQDRFPGALARPVTLHKYLYANGDPISNTDPSGNFSMGETMSALNTLSTLSTIADTGMGLYNSFMEGGASEDSVGLVDVLLAAKMAAEAPGFFESASAMALMGLVAGTVGPQGHHTIPVYLCGADRPQPRVKLDFATHAKLHAELYIGTGLIRKGMDVIVQKYLKRPGAGGRQPTDPIVKLASKKIGREVIAKALRFFYDVNGYLPARVGLNDDLETVFNKASYQFTKQSITSLPTCKR
jgi:RHS repeat-associated protein